MRLRMLVSNVETHAMMVDGKAVARSRVSLVLSPVRYGYDGVIVDVPKDDERVRQLAEVEGASMEMQIEDPDLKAGDELYLDFSDAPGPSLKEMAEAKKAADEKAREEAVAALAASELAKAKTQPPVWLRAAETIWTSDGLHKNANDILPPTRTDALAGVNAKPEDLVGELDKWESPDGMTFRMWNSVFQDSDHKHWRIIDANDPAKLRTALLKTPV